MLACIRITQVQLVSRALFMIPPSNRLTFECRVSLSRLIINN
jgi:hypothetical protein